MANQNFLLCKRLIIQYNFLVNPDIILHHVSFIKYLEISKISLVSIAL